MSNLTINQIYAKEIESEKYSADIYIDTYYTRLLAYEGYKNEVIDFMAELKQDMPLLDVGCGTGFFWACSSTRGGVI